MKPESFEQNFKGLKHDSVAIRNGFKTNRCLSLLINERQRRYFLTENAIVEQMLIVLVQ